MLEFKKVSPLTMGVELELQVINTRTWDLGRGADDLLHALQERSSGGEVKPEITESMIELNSSPHARYASLVAELEAMRDDVVAQADRLNLAIAGGGTHPFHVWRDRRIYPSERFHHLSALYGYLAKQFTVFGQHIHVACESGDDAIYLAHQLSRFIPHFIALSAASPYAQNEDTAFETSRLHAVSVFPLSGHLPAVADWAEFTAYYERMQGFGIVASMKDFYWDIRPKPEYGTVEVRICDTPLDVGTAADLAAFAQTLALWLMADRPYPIDEGAYLVYGYNRFQASRFGFEANLVDTASQQHVRLGDDILARLDALASHAGLLQTEASLARLHAMVRERANGTRWLRERYAETESLADVVRLSAQRWAGTA